MICSVAHKGRMRCSQCKRWLPKNQFSKSKDRKSGLQYWCTSCLQEYWGQNKDQLKESTKRWRRENSTKQRKQQKEWIRKNPERGVWHDMLQRCNNPKNPSYKHYGGRGIKVSYKSFAVFMEDVGKRPSPLYSIDRIDNNGDYKQGNVKWSTMKEQQNNRRNNKSNSGISCSVELPVKYLEEYSGYFDYDFVIASTCISHPEYLEYFLRRKHARFRFTILDNGAFETGEAISDMEYITLAQKLHPNVLVIPDVYKDSSATYVRVLNFLDTWKKAPVDGVKLMGVLQGESWEDLLTMYRILYNGKCEYIGLPYATGIDRYQFLKAHPEIQNVHILGAPTLTEICALNLLPNVVSIDSSLPVKCTMESKGIDNALVSDSYAHPDECELNTSRLMYNLDMFTSLCHGEFDIVPKENIQ